MVSESHPARVVRGSTDFAFHPAGLFICIHCIASVKPLFFLRFHASQSLFLVLQYCNTSLLALKIESELAFVTLGH